MMRKCTALVVCTLSLGALSLSASAAPPAAGKTKAMMCPVCKTMPMTTKKTKSNTQMVKVNGKTMYCCACKMKKK